ncbi:MAG: YkvI family membrane protein [Brevinema sp.]
MNNNFKEITMIGGVLIALNIGAGFASGQELFQFFTAYGLLGFLGGALAFILLLFGCDAIVTAGWVNRDVPNSSVYLYFCGRSVGTFYNFFIPVALFGGFLIMMAGTGSLFSEFFSLPNEMGRFLVVIFTIASFFVDFRAITKVISRSGRIVVIVLSLMSIVMIFKHAGNLFDNHKTLSLINVIRSGDSFYGAGILYASFIVLGSAQFLFEMGKGLPSPNNIFKGIIFGVSLLIGSAMLLHLAMLFHLHEIYELKIITLYFAKNISIYLAWIIALLLFVVMTSSSITNFWGVSKLISTLLPENFPKPIFRISMIFLVILGFFISAIPFTVLINILQPINGLLGMFFIFFIVSKQRTIAYRSLLDQDRL